MQIFKKNCLWQPKDNSSKSKICQVLVLLKYFWLVGLWNFSVTRHLSMVWQSIGVTIEIVVLCRRRMYNKDNVKKSCAKLITDCLNNSWLARPLHDYNTLASQLLFNLSVITLAQGFSRCFYHTFSFYIKLWFVWQLGWSLIHKAT